MRDNIQMDLREVEWGICTGFVWFGVGTSVSCHEHGGGSLGFIKSWELLDQLEICYLVKED